MRKPIVTRNINVRKYIVKCADTTKNAITERAFFIYQKPKTDADALKVIIKLNDIKELHPVAIVSHEDIKIRVMQSVETFLKNGTIIEEGEEKHERI